VALKLSHSNLYTWQWNVLAIAVVAHHEMITRITSMISQVNGKRWRSILMVEHYLGVLVKRNRAQAYGAVDGEA
jgi:hypothetical protein